MKPKLLLGLALVLSGGWFGCCDARADMATYDSVEWLVAMADQIGVYHAGPIYGPHSITNDPQHCSCCFCTADFKLEKALRGNPPATFSRTRQVEKPEQLGFHAGDTYIFFLVAEERLKNVRAKVDSTSEAFFSMWDYLWLERPPGAPNGAAIDRKGRVLTKREDILKLVKASLELPRANPGIDRWAYFYGGDKARYPNNTNFNFRVVSLPTSETVQMNETWAWQHKSWTGLVIPQGLNEQNSAMTNASANSVTNR
jgi:hypothetical protein